LPCGTRDIDERGLGEMPFPPRLPEDAWRAAKGAAESQEPLELAE